MGKTLLHVLHIMVFGLFKPNSGSSVATAIAMSTSTSTAVNAAAAGGAGASDTGTACSSNSSPSRSLLIEDALRNALWAFFAGDALAMPTHWYYGGFPQIQRDYGAPYGITGYTKPVFNLPGSILNKSNINGGGRGSFQKTRGPNGSPISIIGDVINHGKREYWHPNKEIHYHATLQHGENTLEAQLARVLMKCIVQDQGQFHAQHFRDAYVQFMMTPGSHNDTYASTCHRMFFANHILHKLPLDQCPDNDHHNVDTIDGLVLPTITSLAMAAQQAQAQAAGGYGASCCYSLEEIETAAAATAAVTRKSAVLEKASRAWGRLVANALLLSLSSHNGNDAANGASNNNLVNALDECARALGMKQMPSSNNHRHQQEDQMTACYLDSALPATLGMIAKYSLLQQQQQQQQQQGTSTSSTAVTTTSSVVWNALLSNANCGGENVHRGSILGAVLGATQSQYHYSKNGAESDHNDLQLQLLRNGLYHKAQLEQEIDDFVKAVLKK